MEQFINAGTIRSNIANLPQLVFEVTDACNLKCKYCAYGEFYNDYDKREDKNLSVNKAICLIDYLCTYWNSDLCISSSIPMYISFYGGEPLMNFAFIENIVHYVNEKLFCPRRKFRFSMTTNAILLHKYMDFLVKNQFHLLISLDGNKKNNSYRVDKKGNISFERVLHNVDLLREKYPDFFKKNVNFNSVFHNKSTVEEVYSFFKKKYEKVPMFSELNNSGIRKERIDDFEKTYRNIEISLHQAENYDYIERDLFLNSNGYKSLALYLHRYSGFYFKDYTDLLYKKTNLLYIPTGTCMPFSKKMFVTVNGKILPCERIGHKFYLGKVSEKGVSINFENIANRYNQYFDKMNAQCSKCKNRDACIQCFFNLKNVNKPVCYGYMNQKEFVKYEKNQLEFLRKHPEAFQEIMEKVITL